MPFFAKNLTSTSTLLFKGGFVEIKPGMTVQVNDRDARWGVFREAVASGTVELYEAIEPRESNPSQHEVSFEVTPEPEKPVELVSFEVNAVHVEPEVVAPMHSQVFVPTVQVEVAPELHEVSFVEAEAPVEPVVEPEMIVETVQSELEPELVAEAIVEPAPVTVLEPAPETPKPTRKYKTKS